MSQLDDFISSKINAFRNTVNQTAQNVGNTFQTVGNYFNPNIGVVQRPPMSPVKGPVQVPQVRSFWTDIPQINPNQVIENIPKLNLPDFRSAQVKNTPVIGGATAMAGDMIKSFVNAPSNYVQGTMRLTRDVIQPSSTQQKLADVGQIGDAVLNVLPFKGAKAAPMIAEGLGKMGVKKAIVTGATTGGLYGGAQGFFRGLLENKDETIGRQLANSGLSGVLNAAVGATLGGATGAAGSLVQRWINTKPSEILGDLQNLRPNASPEEHNVLVAQYIRDRLGRFAPKELRDVKFVRDTKFNPLTDAEKRALDIKYGWLTESRPGLSVKTLTKEEGKALRAVYGEKTGTPQLPESKTNTVPPDSQSAILPPQQNQLSGSLDKSIPQGTNEQFSTTPLKGSLMATEQKIMKNQIGKTGKTGASQGANLNIDQTISSQSPREQVILQPKEPLSSVANDTRKILADQGGLKEKQLVGRLKTSNRYPEDVRSMLSGTYVPNSNTETINAAKKLVKLDATVAETRAMNPQNAVDQAIGAELFNHYMDNGMTQKANQILNATSGTNEGQMIQILSQYDKTTPQGALKFANNAIKEYNNTHPQAKLGITDAQTTEIYGMAKKIQAMPEGRNRNIAANELIQKVNNMIPSSIADKAITIWKAGLLTSLRTHERNLIGNTIQLGAEAGKDVIASPVDRLMSLRTGQRSMTLTGKGTISGAKTGLQSAKDIFMKGYDPTEQITKYDVRHVTWGNNPLEQGLKKYTDAVFRTLGAEDKPFWNSAYARSLYDQAGAEAANAGKAGDKAFIKSFVDAPTEKMLKTAVTDANYATFHDKSMLSEVANAFKKTASNNEITKLGSEILAPFTGVPSSIAGKLIDYSPVGLMKGSIDTGRVLLKNMPELQRQAAQEVGRGVMGTGLFGLGAYLMSKGLMTGQPKDATEARQWQLENKPANSVLVGGQWRSIGSIGPQNLIVLAGAKYQEEMSKQGGGDIGAYGAGVGKDFMGQTFLQGVQQPLAAINDPARYGQSYLGNQSASVVPNLIKDAARANDPYVRENNNIPDYLRNSIPGLRNQGLIKRDSLGNPIPQEPTGAGAFVDLFNSKTPTSNPVVDELSRLNGTGNNATPSQLNKNQTINKQKITLTPQQLNQFEAGVGPVLQQQLNTLITSPAYQQLPDDLKAKAIDKVVSDVRTSYKLNNAPDITGGQIQSPAPTVSKTKIQSIKVSKSKAPKKLSIKKIKPIKVKAVKPLKFTVKKAKKLKALSYKIPKFKPVKA